jgi:hypothetical protein
MTTSGALFKQSGIWTGTVFAISVFGVIIILMIFLREEYFFITQALYFPIPDISIVTALFGPIGGFIIIIITKIILFLLDPLVWLIKQIWGLIKRAVLYCYRFIISFFGTLEKNNPFWVGATWVVAVGVIIATLVLCFQFRGIAPVIALAAGLAFMGFLMFKRKHDV